MNRAAVNRPLIIAAIGILVVAGAFILNYSIKTPGGIMGALSPSAVAPGGPSFDVVRIDARGALVMAGRAAPGATLFILDGDKEIGRVQADGHGEWLYIPTEPVAPGTRQFSLKAKMPNGTELLSQNVVVMSVPERNGEVLIVEQSRNGGRTRVLQGPNAAPGMAKLKVVAVDYDAAGKFAVSGEADPGSSVQLYLDNTLVGKTIADAKSGAWNLEPTVHAKVGDHKLRVDQLGPRDTVLARFESGFTLDPAQANLQTGEVTVIKGNSLWRIARRIYGEGLKYTIIYDANRDNIKDPDLIYPGQIFSVPKNDARK
jgi:nucleoid-associated protein YgaU